MQARNPSPTDTSDTPDTSEPDDVDVDVARRVAELLAGRTIATADRRIRLSVPALSSCRANRHEVCQAAYRIPHHARRAAAAAPVIAHDRHLLD